MAVKFPSEGRGSGSGRGPGGNPPQDEGNGLVGYHIYINVFHLNKCSIDRPRFNDVCVYCGIPKGQLYKTHQRCIVESPRAPKETLTIVFCNAIKFLKYVYMVTMKQFL